MILPEYSKGHRQDGQINIWKRRSEFDEWIIVAVTADEAKAEFYISRWEDHYRRTRQ